MLSAGSGDSDWPTVAIAVLTALLAWANLWSAKATRALTDQVLRVEPDGRVKVVQSTRFAPGTASARTQVSCP